MVLTRALFSPPAHRNQHTGVPSVTKALVCPVSHAKAVARSVNLIAGGFIFLKAIFNKNEYDKR
jgi:hypothetical protein